MSHPVSEWATLALVCRRAGADLEHAARRLVPGGIDVPDRIAEACEIAMTAAATVTAAAGRMAVLAERRERHDESAPPPKVAP